MSDLVVAHNCSIARMLPEEAKLVSEWTGLSGRAKSVQRFARSDGPDTALYKNYRLPSTEVLTRVLQKVLNIVACRLYVVWCCLNSPYNLSLRTDQV